MSVYLVIATVVIAALAAYIACLRDERRRTAEALSHVRQLEYFAGVWLDRYVDLAVEVRDLTEREVRDNLTEQDHFDTIEQAIDQRAAWKRAANCLCPTPPTLPPSLKAHPYILVEDE